MNETHCDALVLFGAAGDLAYKNVFPALHAMLKRGYADVPIIGVARGRNLEELRARVRDSVEQHGGVDARAFEKLACSLRYVDGEYADAATYRKLCKELKGRARPAHYLAVPPASFATVVDNLAAGDCARCGRVIVEKPFGRDLISARRLNDVLLRVFREADVFRIDHYLGRRPLNNLAVFRFANAFMEPFWNRNYIESVEITMAESLGVDGRGAFYDATGAIRDVVQNHLFQILCNLAMEPPVRTDSESIRDEKAKVLKAIAPIEAADVVRGQFEGYRREPGVAPDSTVETFAALRLEVGSWRWKGVPFYIRAGKRLPVTCTEVLARFRKPPTAIGDGLLSRNHLRFRISPDMTIAIGATVMAQADVLQGQAVEMIASQHRGPEDGAAYERVLGDAMAGDSTLFARKDHVEEAWRIVDPALKANAPVHEYRAGTWGPAGSADSVSPPGGWHDPVLDSKALLRGTRTERSGRGSQSEDSRGERARRRVPLGGAVEPLRPVASILRKSG